MVRVDSVVRVDRRTGGQCGAVTPESVLLSPRPPVGSPNGSVRKESGVTSGSTARATGREDDGPSLVRRVVKNYKNNILNGYYVEYYENKKTKFIRCYHKGIRVGICYIYYDNGNIMKKTHYNEEKLESNEEKLESNEEKLESNEEKLESNEEKLESNEEKLESNEEKLESNKINTKHVKYQLFYDINGENISEDIYIRNDIDMEDENQWDAEIFLLCDIEI